ncbi:hypothetical protein [Rhizobium lentis]|uniref:hypothetical protein n=1 Tax=Rhizobium lentis TaxID=1138194 RepID=UPI001C83D145|nr:hypothetical protein [Rhizobium lentis]MBX4956324.1 hypothetical protein [Rhizobium lentis]MBX4986021.1 hypothetical protein [Rhizobium lentis]MBX5004465.1 hypothetical protein [Rhizobium lentis]MBX5028918.1 hypothetical protein [Rhizobium lentis]MBX5034915.1 hypothetical protein [Rhizobium lentis]
MTIYIVCHKDLPSYPAPEGSKIIWLNSKPPLDNRGMDVIAGYDFFSEPEELHAKLSGSLGTIVVAKIVSEEPAKPRNITIWQYRKFLTRLAIGTPNPDYPGMNTTTSEETEITRPENPAFFVENFFLPRPLNLHNISQHYAHFHNIVDFLRYTASSIETNALTQAEALLFFNSGTFIPGGIELGTYPTDWWLDTFVRLVAPSFEFAKRYQPFQAEDPVQKRAISFCQERLGSYLLIKRLAELYGNNLPGVLFGNIATVSNDGVYKSGA